MTGSIETELRAAMAALMHAREALADTEGLDRRQVVQREIASAQTSVGRALHLIGGSTTETHT